jgi:hypothetical protein
MFDILTINHESMKKLFLLLALISTSIFAQEEFYVGLHYFTIKKEFTKEFIAQEKKYFSKQHKASIEEGKKIGWDMWRVLEPSLDNKHVTFCFAHLQPIDGPVATMGASNYSKEEMQKVWDERKKMVVKTKWIQTVFKGGFVPADLTKPSQFLVLNFIEVNPLKDYEFEKIALNNLEARKNSKYLKSWGLHKILSPSVGDDYPDYIAANFFDSQMDFYKRRIATNQPSEQYIKRTNSLNDIRQFSRFETMELVMFER